MPSDIDFLFAHLPHADADTLHDVLSRVGDALDDGTPFEREEIVWSSPSSVRIVARILEAAKEH